MLCCAVHCPAQDGLLDPFFGTAGIVITDINGFNDVANDLVIQQDGKIIAAGFTSDGIKDFFCLIRYHPNGSLDTNFGSNGIVITNFPFTSVGTTIALQEDNKIILAGQTWTGDVNTFALARYLENGHLDINFGDGGMLTTVFPGTNSVGTAIAIQNDGKIILGGHTFVIGNDADDFALARYHPNGQLDDSFGNGGLVTTDFGIPAMDWLNDLQLQADGKIIAAGFSDHTFTLVRYLINGQLDASFGINGVVKTVFPTGDFGSIKSIDIQADNKIVAAGFVLDSFSNFALTRYLPSGELDLDFGDEGITISRLSATNDGINTIQIQADGKIVAGGVINENTTRHFALARYQPNGYLDPTFGDNGVQTTLIHTTTNVLNAIAIQNDHNIVAAGFSGDYPYNITLTRYTSNIVGTENMAFFPGQLSLYPNPFKDYVTIEYDLDASYNISMYLLNAQGQFIQNIIKNEQASQGNNQLKLDLSAYPAGTYFINFQIEDKPYSIQLFKT